MKGKNKTEKEIAPYARANREEKMKYSPLHVRRVVSACL